jgi:hypothetical protein
MSISISVSLALDRRSFRCPPTFPARRKHADNNCTAERADCYRGLVYMKIYERNDVF